MPADIEPVYPKVAGQVHPLAERACRALHGTPVTRRAACCEDGGAAAALPEKECLRMLSFAAGEGASAIDEARLAACEAEMTKLHEGCGWVGLGPRPLPDACLGLIEGKRPEGEACRSSLECSGELVCYGLSATRKGRCVAARPAGAICGVGSDPLVALARQNDAYRKHPECKGQCRQSRCVDEPAPPPPRAEERQVEGEACSSDVECLGRCEKQSGSASGTCVKQCRPAKPLDLSGRPSASATR